MSDALDTRRSLVDVAEDALRTWLAGSRRRRGERLPPEQELCRQLGISRGTLRTALRRLEESGEIVRRQGSGTYVGKTSSPTIDEGLESLTSYAELARRHGMKIELGELDIGQTPLGSELAELFGSEPEVPATTVTRVLLLDGQRWASMRDVVRPDIELPSAQRLHSALKEGQMVLDVLREKGLPMAYARTRIMTRVVTGKDRIGKALGVSGAAAALELVHVTCTVDGTPVEHSTDIFLPGHLDLHVMRYIADSEPALDSVGRIR